MYRYGAILEEDGGRTVNSTRFYTVVGYCIFARSRDIGADGLDGHITTGGRHADDADEGAATAEFAVVLPCVAAVAILVLCLGRASVVSMNCQDAAAAGARAFAVDDTGGESKARAAAVAAAGDSVTVRFDRGTDSVTVTVQCPVISDPTGMLPTRVTGKATRYF